VLNNKLGEKKENKANNSQKPIVVFILFFKCDKLFRNTLLRKIWGFRTLKKNLNRKELITP
jgi:hypothetical protein